MNQPYFDQWSKMAKKMQEPLQALAELNVKTLQNIHYLKPDEFANIKKPEEFIEKQIGLAVENSHKTLDYMQKAFQIMEQAMLSFVQETRNQAQHQEEKTKNVKK